MTQKQHKRRISPAGSVRKRYHHGDLRAALIEATRQLVEENGPDNFSVSDACRLAGVSTAAPYKHFRDKTDMMVAAVLEGITRHRTNVLTALEGTPEGTPERIVAIGREYVRFALREPGIFRLKFGGFTDRIAHPQLDESGRQIFGIVLEEIAKCVAEKEITRDVQRRGFMLWTFLHGLSFILYDKELTAKGGNFELEELLEDAVHRILS